MEGEIEFMKVCCPDCNSEDVYKVSHIYEAMTQETKTSSNVVGVGLGNNGAGILVGTSSSSGETQSLLAKKLSPPANPSANGCGCVLAIIAIIVLIFVSIIVGVNSSGLIGWAIFIFGSIFISVLAVKMFTMKHPEYDEELRVWNKKWVCNRCGTVFILDQK